MARGPWPCRRGLLSYPVIARRLDAIEMLSLLKVSRGGRSKKETARRDDEDEEGGGGP